jgi:glutaredoxin
MRPTLVARMYSAQLTLFTRASCGLCDVAKARVNEVLKKRTVDYHEVDIIAEGNQKWRNMYGKRY